MKPTAILLTLGELDTKDGKTAHGLILGSSRYEILAVIDEKHAGKDAGVIIDGKHRDIPVFKDVPEAVNQLKITPDYCVVGAAPYGGALTDSFIEEIGSAITHNINIVNGLHTLVSENSELNTLAKKHGVDIIDIRKPKPTSELHIWTGEIANLKTPRIAMLGTDCTIGKRTTCYTLLDLCRQNNINAEMIYTGQTGWLQGFEYGFIFDSTINDFVSGELEHEVLRCAHAENPDLILIEGQASLRNPSGPCGAEMLLSAGAKYVVLQHCPGRDIFATDPLKQHKIPSLQDEIDLIKLYGAQVIAVTLNTSEMGSNHQIENVDVPILKPREEGLDKLLPIIQDIVSQS